MSKADLEKLLLTHKRELDPNALLRLLTASSQDDATILFVSLIKLRRRRQFRRWCIASGLRNGPSVSTLPVYSHASEPPAVRDTLVKLLTDPHKNVRLVALSGLAAMRLPFDVGPLCPLLHDPEAMVRGKATEVLLDF